MTQIRNSWSFVSVSKNKTYTREEAIERAKKYGLEYEVTYFMDHGDTPNQALAEWDLL